MDDISRAVVHIERMLQKVREADLRWPKQASGFKQFADDVVQLTNSIRTQVRNQQGKNVGFAGGSRGTSADSGYSVLHMSRLLVFSLERGLGPEILDDAGATMKDVARWTPDQHKNLGAILDMSTKEARRLAGCSPLLHSCLLCFCGDLGNEALHRLNDASPKEIIEPIRTWEATLQNLQRDDASGCLDLDDFSPTPQTLLASILTTAEGRKPSILKSAERRKTRGGRGAEHSRGQAEHVRGRGQKRRRQSREAGNGRASAGSVGLSRLAERSRPAGARSLADSEMHSGTTTTTARHADSETCQITNAFGQLLAPHLPAAAASEPRSRGPASRRVRHRFSSKRAAFSDRPSHQRAA